MPSKFSDMSDEVAFAINKLLELPIHIEAGEACTDTIAVLPFIVTVFDAVAPGQLPLPLAVKVSTTLPAAISAALGV